MQYIITILNDILHILEFQFTTTILPVIQKLKTFGEKKNEEKESKKKATVYFKILIKRLYRVW